MRTLLSTLALLLAVSAPSETIWIAQTAQGGDTGADAANAHSAAWFNTAGNWGAGADKVSAGDTVMLSGTISSALTVQGSGSAGSPITIQFATGAKLSTGSWTSSGALIGSSKNYVTVLGGLIESTSNGEGLTTTNDDYHLKLSSCNNWTVSGLTCSNVFVPMYGGSNAFGTAIYSLNGSDLTITNCTLVMGGKILLVAFSAGNSNVTIINNTITNCIVGCTVGSSTTTTWLDGLNIKGNHIGIGTNWSGGWNGDTVWHHTDCIHNYAGHTGSYITNEVVSGNYLGKENSTYSAGGTVTAWLYLEATLGTNYYPQVFNNVLEIGSGANQGASVGQLDCKGHIIQPGIYNNTFVGVGTRTGIYLDSNVESARITNNIFSGLALGIWDDSSAPSPAYDNNLYYNNSNVARKGATYYATLANWQTGLGGCPAAGADCNSVASDPLFVSASDFHLQSSSPCIGVGAVLNSIFTTDFAGTTRGAAWDIGAYEYVAPAPPSAITLNAGNMRSAP